MNTNKANSVKRMTQIPKIDISGPTDQNKLASPLTKAFSDTGFCFISGHGIDRSLTDKLRLLIKELFVLPQDTLQRFHVRQENYRGYVPPGFFTPNDGGNSDLYAAWKLHWEAPEALAWRSRLFGANRWPPVPELRDTVLLYWSLLDALATRLLHAIEAGLGLSPGDLNQWFEAPLTNMTLLHYPDSENKNLAFHPHKDFAVLTILPYDPVGGLQVMSREGDWIDAVGPRDALLVNAGDILEIWSGGRLRSAPHRVVNWSGQERISFPWFAVPEPELNIEPLVEPIPDFERATLNCGDASLAVWSSNWPEAQPPSGIALTEFDGNKRNPEHLQT